MDRKLNPTFAGIVQTAIDEYGWTDFHREPFFVKSNGGDRMIITLASRPMPTKVDIRLVACPMILQTVEFNTILYRIKLRLEEQREDFVCLFQAYDGAIYFGNGQGLDHFKFEQRFLECEN